MKTGRNEPCPCGSGRKYKQCCLATQQAAPTEPDALSSRRLRRVLQGFPPLLVEYALARAPQVDPWALFCRASTAFETVPADIIDDLFLSWVCYSWVPPVGPAGAAPCGAWAYLVQYGKRLDPLLLEYLQSALRSPYSYYQVRSVRPGGRFEMVDLLDLQIMQVHEDNADDGLSEGSICFGKIVPVGDIAVIDALFGWSLRSDSKPAIVELRTQLPLLDRAERASPAITAMMLAHLGQWLEGKLLPTEPMLCNRHGDEIDRQVLRYEIDSLSDCCQALQDLDPEGLPEDAMAEDDGGDGLPPRVHLHWVDNDADSTLLAIFDLGPGRLRVKVNSRERAERVRALLTDRLGAQVRPSEEDPGRFDALLGSYAHNLVLGDDSNSDQSTHQSIVEEFLARHYESWPDIALPALDGLTPLQAMQDPVGRAKVAALVEDLVSGPVPVPANVYGRLQERLGLG